MGPVRARDLGPLQRLWIQVAPSCRESLHGKSLMGVETPGMLKVPWSLSRVQRVRARFTSKLMLDLRMTLFHVPFSTFESIE